MFLASLGERDNYWLSSSIITTSLILMVISYTVVLAFDCGTKNKQTKPNCKPEPSTAPCSSKKPMYVYS